MRWPHRVPGIGCWKRHQDLSKLSMTELGPRCLHTMRQMGRRIPWRSNVGRQFLDLKIVAIQDQTLMLLMLSIDVAHLTFNLTM